VRKPQARFSKSSSGLDNEFPSFCTSNEIEEAKNDAQTRKRLGTDGRDTLANTVVKSTFAETIIAATKKERRKKHANQLYMTA
jgi:hypothetical protein